MSAPLRHSWRAAWLAVALCLAVGPAAGADDEAGATADTAKPPFAWSDLGLTGTAILKHFFHFYETANDRQNIRTDGTLQLEWARRLAPWSDVKIVGEARGDDGGFTRGVTFDVQETSERRSVLNLKETELRLRHGPVDGSLGKQIFAWGTADGFNPTDVLNPYDYLDVIEREKIGVYSAAARLTTGRTTLTVVVLPVFTPSRLPLLRSRWTPEFPAELAAGLAEREVPPVELENVQYGARLRTTFRGIDLSASYYDGFEHTPVLRVSTVPVGPGLVVPRFTPVFTRFRMAGFDVSTTYRGFEFHGEGAFKFVTANGRDDRFHGIAGLNYRWSDLGRRWLDEVVVVLEYAREAILASRRRSSILPREASPLVGDPRADAFRDAVVGRILARLTDDTHVQVSGTVNLVDDPNHYVQLKVGHKLTDTWHLEGGLDFLGGDRRTFWGRWRDNDRFFFATRYLF